MDNMIRIDKDYIEWLKHVKKRFKNTQIKASIKVNDELLRFYWSIGKDNNRAGFRRKSRISRIIAVKQGGTG